MTFDVPHFEREFEAFSDSTYRHFNDGPFTSFTSDAADGWEGYKPKLRERALAELSAGSWTEGDIGSGKMLDGAIAAIEIKDTDQTRNNLVSWEGRYGPGSASHAPFVAARTN